MSSKIMRYHNAELIENLAHQYVLGTQSMLVRKRITRLRMQHTALDQRINYWEAKFSPLNNDVPELMPKKNTWQAIEQQLQLQPQHAKKTLTAWFGLGFHQAASAFSLLALAVTLFFQQPSKQADPLSYIAIMNDKNQQPQLVATTYGGSRTLSIELLNTPAVPSDMSLELWVTSKTDKQVRSLGIIPINKNVFNRALTEPEWRLIKDSENLLLTLEEKGGSPYGEPMGTQVSKGLCIQMASWQENV